MSDDLAYYRDLAEKIFNPSNFVGLATGYSELDRITSGLKAGSLVVLAGTSGTGKSLFALNILVNLAKRGVEVEYYDLENSALVTHQRLASIWTGSPRKRFFDDLEFATATLSEISEHLNYFDHEFVQSPRGNSLFKNVFQYISVSRAKVFLVDPLQALEEEVDGQKNLNEQGKYVRYLKELAQKSNKIIILCHHMRKSQMRSGEWVTDLEDTAEQRYMIPTVDDLRGSGKVVDYATDVWGIVRTSGSKVREGRGKTLLRVLKNRTGLRGDLKLFFDEDTLQFHERKEPEKDIYADFFGGKI